MSNSDVILSQIRQRLEILYQMVDELEAGGGGGGGTTNYNNLTNKPSIEGIQLVGNKTASDLGLATTSELNGKVDKVTGSSLMTTAQANKLEGIQAGAEVNVQADWNQANSSADDYIKNKPTLGAAAEKNVDTVPTDGSSNLITSGAVYDAVQGSGGSSGLNPIVISMTVGQSISVDDYNKIKDGQAFKDRENGLVYVCYQITSTELQYLQMQQGDTNDDSATVIIQGFLRINKNTKRTYWNSTGGGHGYYLVNDKNLFSTFYGGYYTGSTTLPAVASNFDNNYNAGVYSKRTVGTITNCPTTEAGYLIVDKIASNNTVVQEFHPVSSPTIYKRIRQPVDGVNTWGSWYKFEGTIVS